MNREQWLAEFASRARNNISATISGGGDEEPAIRLSCGFSPRIGRKQTKAAIVPPTASDDFTAEIFISPEISEAREVARHLLPLLTIAQSGNWRSAAPMVAEPVTFIPMWAEPILDSIGAYPHSRLNIEPATKQTTRLIKASCAADNYIVRVSRSTLLTLGAPICPACLNPMNWSN